MNAIPAPPPHMGSSQQVNQSQIPLPQQPQQQSGWPSTPMTFEPNQWQTVFPQGLRFSPNTAWCPPTPASQSIYNPPMLFTPHPTAFDYNQSQQPIYQPAYVLSPQGILVPAQAPYFVPVAQHLPFQTSIQPNVSQEHGEVLNFNMFKGLFNLKYSWLLIYLHTSRSNCLLPLYKWNSLCDLLVSWYANSG